MWLARRASSLDASEKSEAMSGSVVCVTGGGGYIGSWLVRKLLDRGCVVHATVRNLGMFARDPSLPLPLCSASGARDGTR